MGTPFFKERRFLDKDMARELYDLGYCDQQIADACDVSLDSVRVWRKKYGLSGHKAPHKTKTKSRTPTTLVEMAAEAKSLGMSYGEYMVARREGKL